MQSKPLTVIFDLDGVLIDSRQLMEYAFEKAFRTVVCKKSPVPINEFLTHLGDYFPNILKKMGLPIEMWEIFRQISMQNINKIKVFPQIENILNRFKANNVSMAICTGKDYRRTLDILKHFNLKNFFSSVVTPEMVPKAKPWPDSIFFALNEMNVKHTNIYYIGDALNDLLCAKNAHVKSIFAIWGTSEDKNELQALADYTAEKPFDLLSILNVN